MVRNQSISEPFDSLVKEEEAKLPEELRPSLRSYLEHAANGELSDVSKKLEKERVTKKNDFDRELRNIEKKLEE